jgi:hypothetical protein
MLPLLLMLLTVSLASPSCPPLLLLALLLLLLLPKGPLPLPPAAAFACNVVWCDAVDCN